MQLKDKIVLITGGSSGIGAETAKRFAQEGAYIVISYKSNRDGADAMVSDIQRLGQDCLMQQADLKNESEAKKLVEAAMARFGRIDILINNAGRYVDGDEWDGSSEIWKESLEQNLISAMNVSKYVIPIFQEQQSGVMINIASRHALAGQFDSISYAAAKAGIVNITQAYAKLLTPFGRANSISPGAVDCGYWLTAPVEERRAKEQSKPSGKLIDVSKIVDAIIHVASDNSISGQNISVNE